jgi:hypothetical protein
MTALLRRRCHTWTSIALKHVISNVAQPTRVSGLPVHNPHGISGATAKFVFNTAAPGSETFRDFLTSIGVDFSANGANGMWSAQACTNVSDSLGYSGSSDAFTARQKEGVVVLDILLQQFKSYQEMMRSLLVQITVPHIFNALEKGAYILSIGDFPKILIEWIICRQGDDWGAKAGEDQHRGWKHLGKLLHAATSKTDDGSNESAHYLWDNWMVTCGALNDAAGEELAGKCVSGIVPHGPGPLHTWINPLTDLVKFWPFLFESLELHTSGKSLHSKIKAKEVGCRVEGLLAAWEMVRSELLPKLTEKNEMHITTRFDITAFLYLMESSMPMAHLVYQLFIRGNYKGDQAAQAAGRNLHREALAYLCAESHIRERKNYPRALLAQIDQLNYWERTKHPLYDWIVANNSAYDEIFGENVSVFKDLIVHPPTMHAYT